MGASRPKPPFGHFGKTLFRTLWAVVFSLTFLSTYAANPTKLGDLDGDGLINVFDLTRLREHIRGTATLPEKLIPFADINGDGFINEDDSVALINTITGANATQTLPLASIRESSPFAGEGDVSLTREVVVRFTMPLSLDAVLTTWDANLQKPGTFYAEGGGRKLLTRVELSGDRLKATLFFLEPVPASTRITVTFNDDSLRDLLDRQIDPDGDGTPAGVFTFSYDTAPITAVAGTGIVGHVYASEKASPTAPDVPLAGALVRVVGSETLFTTTAADGSFSLNPCPAGRFFVEVDGRTCPVSHFPDGGYYPYIVKAWETLPGKTDNLAAGTGKIYLPLVPAGTLKPVSATQMTTVSFAPSAIAANPALAGVEIYVPPNSLFADDGTRGGKVGLAPVASDRLPEPLPPGLHHALDISIQTDGATNFDRPVPVKFPNLPDPVTGIKLPPGAKSALWSFNHDTGQWEIAGPMTVTDDGNFVVTDVGVGVRQPGWHGANPGGQGNGGPDGPPCNPAPPPNPGDDSGCPEGQCGLFDYGFIAPSLKVGKEFWELSNAIKSGVNAVSKGVGSLWDVAQGINKARKIGNGIGELQEALDEYKKANDKNRACLNCPNSPASNPPDPINNCGPGNIGPGAPPDAPPPIGPAMENLGNAIRVGITSISSVFLCGQSIRDAADKLLEIGEKVDPNLSPRFGLTEAEFQEATDAIASLNHCLYSIGLKLKDIEKVLELSELLSASAANEFIGDSRGSNLVLFENLDLEVPSVIRIKTSLSGEFTANLVPETDYAVTAYNPLTNSYGRVLFHSPANGSQKKIPKIPLVGDRGLDSDLDGISDAAEAVLGTDPTKADTDADGITDGAEVRNGTNPLDNKAALTGALSTLDTPGQSKDIAAQNNVALLADGSEGISVFNVANALNPVRTGQVRLAGSTESVALDGTRAAATGSSLSLLDLSDLSNVKLTKQLSLGGTPRSVTTASGVAYTGLDNGQIVAVDMAAGAELERVKISTEPIHDLAFSGDVLYARSSSRVYAIDLASGGMVVSGNVAIPAGSAARQRLFAGVGLAYAPMESGYTILSLADPLHPAVAQTISVAQRGWREFVPTGSGLGLGIFTNFGQADLHLYNIGASGTTSQFLTTFTTPGDSQAVSIFNGLAYVADGDAGLTVVNYKAYDALGIPPTINVSTGFASVGGVLQAEEGKLGRITAAVTDDVQVRNVEFYLDGQLVTTDGNFPFEHRFTTPLLAAGKTSFTLRAKATDTGGNATFSNTLTVNLVADATPPRVVKFLPANGSYTGSLRNLAVTFNEPINQTTINATTVKLTGAGIDGVFGTSDDLTPANGTISYRDASNAVFIAFPADLAPSLYRLVLSPPLADLAGNPIALPTQAQFRVFSFQDSDGDGIPDDVELILGTNPNNPDSDGDGLSDGLEDDDNDGLVNAAEIAFGLDPKNPDSNGNGIQDGLEDPDGDALKNQREFLAGTDPNKADTDSDGWNDETEVTGGSNPLDARSKPLGLVFATPQTYIVRLGDLTSGLLANGSVMAQPSVFLARTSSDPNAPNGGLGSAAFIATPAVFTSRQVSSGGPNGGTGSASVIATPQVNISRLSLVDGTGTTAAGASIIATPQINTTRVDGKGAILSQPTVNIQIQTP